MNILAIMGAHGVFYKDEPLRELDVALSQQGFQLIRPKNTDDLLKLIEHNPRISGVIFDWDEHNSPELCGEINQLNEYLPLYAFINTHSQMDISINEMRLPLHFFEYALNAADDIALHIRQYTDDYLDHITPPLTKALFTYVKEGKYTFCTPGHMAG
ncbi:lysine decarboxylase LdcC, partial [Pantoea ananatis]